MAQAAEVLHLAIAAMENLTINYTASKEKGLFFIHYSEKIEIYTKSMFENLDKLRIVYYLNTFANYGLAEG